MEFSGLWVVWSLLGAHGEKKRENQMYLQSPLSGEKKVQALFFSRKKKKIHLAEIKGGRFCGWNLRG